MEVMDKKASTASPRPAKARRIAGQDPVKRSQIVAGARAVFTTMGFDAASMNDIARAASVSKGTLYVYFQNKEQLFFALIDAEKERHRQELFGAMEEDPDIRNALCTFGRRLAQLVSKDWILRAQRVVLGVSERMPELGRTFFEQGPLGTARRLAAYLDRQVADGALVIPDTFLAAVQFIELAQARIVRPRLYCAVAAPPTDAEIAATVESAVAMFLAAYQPVKAPS
jgi:AcrR family transcriptional regulator